jgi:hypothetical protein
MGWDDIEVNIKKRKRKRKRKEKIEAYAIKTKRVTCPNTWTQ